LLTKFAEFHTMVSYELLIHHTAHKNNKDIINLTQSYLPVQSPTPASKFQHTNNSLIS